MKKLAMAAALAASIVVPGQAFAGSNIAGAGFTMCGDFEKNVSDQQTREMIVSWMLGFFSGMNANNDAEGKPQRDLAELGTEEKAGALIDEVVKACEGNADSPLVSQVYPLYETLTEYTH